MSVTDYFKKYIPEEIYAIFTTIFLFLLDGLNKRLLSIFFDNPINFNSLSEFVKSIDVKSSIELLEYENWVSVKYFFVTLVLLAIGIFIIRYRVKLIRNESYSQGEIVSSVVSIIAILILIFLLFAFINNPIFRAIFIAIGAVCAGGIIIQIYQSS